MFDVIIVDDIRFVCRWDDLADLLRTFGFSGKVAAFDDLSGAHFTITL